MTDPRGRIPIGIAQPPGQGGQDYPLIYPEDQIKRLFADLFLVYEDDAGLYEPPFSIAWLYGFGSDPAIGTPPSSPDTYEIAIKDANGLTVFDSTVGTVDKSNEVWQTRLLVVKFNQTSPKRQHLSVITHAQWSPDDDPQTYPIYWEPSNAVLHARTIMRDPPRIRSIQVGLNTFTDTDLQFKNGYNTLFTGGEVDLSGPRRTTEVVLNASPGLGVGKFGPPCNENDDTIRRINGVSPTTQGQFFLDTSGCYRVERPIQAELAALPAREVQVRNHALQVSNDCGACCECSDFIAVWEAIRKLRNRYASLVEEAQAARDLYHANRLRFISQQECRTADRLRLSLLPNCPGQLGVAAGFCNNSDECLVGLVIHISFDYTDGNSCPDLDGSTPLTASTTAPFSSVVCDSTFRGGFVDQARRPKKQNVRNEYYTLGGSWPHFWAHFPQVNPGAMAFVTFRLQFDNPDTDDIVEAVADAFQTGSQTVVSGGSPVSGYSLGTGCTTTACEAPVHLVDCPVKETSALIPECCEESANPT